MKKNYAFHILILSTLVLLSACQKEATNGNVTIFINYNVGGQELVTNDFRYTCAAGYTFEVTRLQYYLSNFTLRKDDGTEYFLDEVFYQELGTTDPSIPIPDVPPGTYTSLSFVYGLDADTNVDGGLPNTLTNINMEWPLSGDQGYHYMKFEGKYKLPGTGEEKAFNLHTGATGNNQNFIEITLPIDNGLKIDGNTMQLQLNYDLNEWLQNPNTWDFEVWGPMIMANQDAQLALKANGATAFSIEPMNP